MKRLPALILFLFSLVICAQGQVATKDIVSSASDPSSCVVGKLYINTNSPGKLWARIAGGCVRVDGVGAIGAETDPIVKAIIGIVKSNGSTIAAAGASDLPSGIDAAKIADGTVSSAEFQFINSVTSNVQTQIDGKQASLGFTPENSANKDAASGYAGLTAGSLLKTAEFPAFTGDATSSSGGVALTLATVNGNVGTVGSATTSLTVTANGKGLITAISSQTVTPAVGSITGLGTGVGTWLAIPSSANLRSALTDELGTGAALFDGATPTSFVLTSATGLPLSTGVTGTLAAAQEPAHTGDVTNSAGSLALAIANNAVTLAKLATQATNTVLGNATSGTAVPTALAVGTCSTAGSALIWTTNTGFGCNASITAAAVPASGLTGTTLASGVSASSLTSLGTITTLTATTINAFTLGGTIAGGGNQLNNIIIGTTTPLAGSFTAIVGTSSAINGTETITSASATALTAGRLGATTPALQVDASTATSITGIKIKSAAAGGGVAISAIGEASNGNLTLDAQGSGTITVGGTSTGAITLTRATTMSNALTYGGVTLSNAVTGTGNMTLSTSPQFTTGIGVGQAADGTKALILAPAAASDTIAKMRFNNVTATNVDAAFSTYPDSLGTDLWIGSNGMLDSTGNLVRFSTSQANAGLHLQRQGVFQVYTSAASVTPALRFKVDATGKIFMPTITAASAASGADACFQGSGATQEIVTDTALCIVSARRFKFNIADSHVGLSFVNQLHPVSYLLRENPERGPQFGFIAEEVEKIDKRFVTYQVDGQVRSVLYIEMIPVLTKAIQEMQEQHKTDHAQIEIQRRQIEQLKQLRRRSPR